MTNEPKQPGVTPGSQKNQLAPLKIAFSAGLFRENFTKMFPNEFCELPESNTSIEELLNNVCSAWVQPKTLELQTWVLKEREIQRAAISDALTALKSYGVKPFDVFHDDGTDIIGLNVDEKLLEEILQSYLNQIDCHITGAQETLQPVKKKKGAFKEQRFNVLLECASFWENILGQAVSTTDNQEQDGKMGPFGRFVLFTTEQVLGTKVSAINFSGSCASSFVTNNRDEISRFIENRKIELKLRPFRNS